MDVRTRLQLKAVILAGGIGTRLWPLARQSAPKPLVRLLGDETLLQRTFRYACDLFDKSDIFVVCGKNHYAKLRRLHPNIPPKQIIVEPCAGGTASSIGWASMVLKAVAGDATAAVIPIDEGVDDTTALKKSLTEAAVLAAQGWLVAFGTPPLYPSSAYGYLRAGRKLVGMNAGAAFRVNNFVEKPPLDQVRKLLKSKRTFWNTGFFVWKTETFLRELGSHMKPLHRLLYSLISEQRQRRATLPMDSKTQRLLATSVDVGVLEKSSKLAMVPLQTRWRDFGNWRAVAWHHGKNHNDECLSIQIDCADCSVWGKRGKLYALLGVGGLVIVDTPDALLICGRNRAETTGDVCRILKKEGTMEFT